MLVEFDGKTITYDEIGNPISYLGNTMSWTGRQLDSITKADGTSISYTYDLDGIRTKKTVNGITTEYFVNGTTILAQKMGNDIIWFIYDVDGEILGFTYNDTPYYYIKNLQGDVVKIVDGMGVPVATYTYDPWGKITSTTGTLAEINPIRYRGYYYDSETGLYYLNSRYYDPETCRFINADGYVTTGQGLLSYNMFAYCSNNPITRTDDSGCFWVGIGEKFVEWVIEPLANCANTLAAAVASIEIEIEVGLGFGGSFEIAGIDVGMELEKKTAELHISNDNVDVGTESSSGFSLGAYGFDITSKSGTYESFITGSKEYYNYEPELSVPILGASIYLGIGASCSMSFNPETFSDFLKIIWD